ncbi:MAG: FHA domain-containing protein [Deltaproteobacteria bacterium]|nr:FHA domain-containing protein [Deltaproteobacteria bacterium]
MGQFPVKQLFLEYLGAPTRFLERHPHPWLVLSPNVRPKGDLSLRTSVYSLDGKPTEDDAPERIMELTAVEIAKRSINAFGLGITVGRTKNNDLYINDERISRFHAYFRVQESSWQLSDAGSKNGTFLDGTRLDQRRSQPLPPMAVLDFGGYRTRFFMPTPFTELLRKLTPHPPSFAR